MTTREAKKLAAKWLELNKLELDQNPSDEKKLQIEILELEIKILELEIKIHEHPEKEAPLISLLTANKNLLTEKEKALNHLRSNSTTGMVCCSRAQILSSTPPATTPAPTTHSRSFSQLFSYTQLFSYP
jgi:hypothetical protein